MPLPGVSVGLGEDERLEVTSPFVSVGEALAEGRGRTLMGDRIELADDGSFLLRGRADRIVKVGEKRLALPEMEAALEAHPHVAEAALIVREQAGVGRVHAVVAPTPGGREALAREGRRGFGAALTRHLSARFDPVLLPRAWRTVEALPRDAQDQVTRAALEDLFEELPSAAAPEALFDESPSPGAESPGLRVVEEHREEDGHSRTLEVGEALPQLEGHFDGFPVVPGVVQLGWAVDAAAAWLGERPALAGLEALKLPRPLTPGRTVDVRVARGAKPGVLRFEIRDERDVFASGRLVLEGGPA
jgi:3-hydroxymyristoyl/3-hydroxydecanoyl-(acyl carrier protein) dehydratase